VTGLGSGRATVPGGLRDWRGGLVLLEPMDEVIGGHGPADVVALDRVAAKRVQLPQGHHVLDPFGDHPEAKVAARSTVERTITASRLLLVIWDTNDRSILSSCTGRVLRCAIEE
jgi:hypothetical protein